MLFHLFFYIFLFFISSYLLIFVVLSNTLPGVHQVPLAKESMIRSFLDVSLVPDTTIRRVVMPLLFDVIKWEWQQQKDLSQVRMVSHVHKAFRSGRFLPYFFQFNKFNVFMVYQNGKSILDILLFVLENHQLINVIYLVKNIGQIMSRPLVPSTSSNRNANPLFFFHFRLIL